MRIFTHMLIIQPNETVSGGAGALGTAIGKAILESGGDVVFSDVSLPASDIWSIAN